MNHISDHPGDLGGAGPCRVIKVPVQDRIGIQLCDAELRRRRFIGIGGHHAARSHAEQEEKDFRDGHCGGSFG